MIQVFVNVDENGNIKSVYSGKNIVMTEPYHYCFIKEEEIADEAYLYKVVINKMVPELVLKSET